jgi:hypothetical protein
VASECRDLVQLHHYSKVIDHIDAQVFFPKGRAAIDLGVAVPRAVLTQKIDLIRQIRMALILNYFVQ